MCTHYLTVFQGCISGLQGVSLVQHKWEIGYRNNSSAGGTQIQYTPQWLYVLENCRNHWATSQWNNITMCGMVYLDVKHFRNSTCVWLLFMYAEHVHLLFRFTITTSLLCPLLYNTSTIQYFVGVVNNSNNRKVMDSPLELEELLWQSWYLQVYSHKYLGCSFTDHETPQRSSSYACWMVRTWHSHSYHTMDLPTDLWLYTVMYNHVIAHVSKELLSILLD